MPFPGSPARATASTGRTTRTPLVIGHRGAPAYRPEHTAASYELAIDLGADLIEPDLVLTRDGVLVARHENELSRSTDVAAHPEFAGRRRTQDVDGTTTTGWFTEDFTLAELRTLRAVERTPELRPTNTAYDRRYGVLTFAEVVALARRRSTAARPVGVLAELKHPGWWAAQGMPMVGLVAAELRRLGAAGADSPVTVQTFEPGPLRALRTELGGGPRLVQLTDSSPASAPLTTPAGLRGVSTYADGIAVSRDQVLLRDADNRLVGVSDLVGQAHRAGLSLFVWTLRPENAHLPRHLRSSSDPAAHGDASSEARLLYSLGADGVITDAPETAARARADLAAPIPTRPRAQA